MQQYFLIILGVFGLFKASAQNLLLSAGEAYTNSFNSLPYVAPYPDGSSEGAQAIFYFTNDLFSTGDIINIELFENSITNAPFKTMQFTGSATPKSSLFLFGSGGWQDLQGVIRLSVLAGSVNLCRTVISSSRIALPSGYYAIQIDFPHLDSRITDSGLILSWPTNQVGFTLQAAADLNSSTNWIDSTNSPAVVGAQFTITNSISGNAQFYRLHKP